MNTANKSLTRPADCTTDSYGIALVPCDYYPYVGVSKSKEHVELDGRFTLAKLQRIAKRLRKKARACC